MRAGTILMSVLVVVLSACTEITGGPPPDSVRAIVQKVAPSGWGVAEETVGQLPVGHYWGDLDRSYLGPRGRRIVLTGPRDVAFRWRDKAGAWHEDNVLKEALELWLMPGSYKESWASRLNLFAREAAELLFSATNVKVYATPTTRFRSQAQFNTVLKEAVETGGTNVRQSLSWSTWRADLKREFASYRVSRKGT